MKLNSAQINTIDAILEKLGVVYIDYKFEILDHIASEVEELMEETGENFEKSLEIILIRWQPKLRKSSSTWFGYLWEMPEILMQKAKKYHQQKMLLLLVPSFLLAFVMYYLVDFTPHFFNGLWYLLVVVLCLQFMGYIQIRRSKQKTTFGFLYKQQFLAFFFLYIQNIFSLHSYERIFENSNWAISIVFLMISILLFAPLVSYKFYQEHFKQLNRNQKFI